MAWADVFAGIGGAAGGVAQGLQYKQEVGLKREEMDREDKRQKVQGEILKMLKTLEHEQRLEENVQQAGFSESLQQKVIDGSLSLEMLKNMGARELQDMVNKNQLTITDRNNIKDMSIAELREYFENKRNEATNKQSGINAQTAAGASRYASDASTQNARIGAASNEAEAMITAGGRAADTFPSNALKAFEIESQYTPEATLTPQGRIGGPRNFQQFMSTYQEPQRPAIAPPPPPPAPAPIPGQPLSSSPGTDFESFMNQQPPPGVRPPAPVTPRPSSTPVQEDPLQELKRLSAMPVPTNPAEKLAIGQRIRQLQEMLAAQGAR